MEPSGKRRKQSNQQDENNQLVVVKQTKIQIKLNEIADKMCNLIDNKAPNIFNNTCEYILDYQFEKLRIEQIVRVVNHIEKNTVITKLHFISINIINNDGFKYLFTKLLTNNSINSLEFANINFDNINYFDQLQILLSIPNKIQSLVIHNALYHIDVHQYFINQLTKIIQTSFLNKLQLKRNNFTFSEMIEIIKVLPKTVVFLDITLEYETHNFVQNKIDPDDQLVLEFANALRNTNLTTLNISYHLFNFAQSCIIVQNLPKTLKTFRYSIRNNNYAIKNLFQNMQTFSNLLYKNLYLLNVDVYYRAIFIEDQESQDELIVNNNLTHLINNRPLYNTIISRVNFNKLLIHIRNNVLKFRNLYLPLDKSSIFTMILCMNRINKYTNNWSFLHLPEEILSMVLNFIFDKSVLVAKNKVYDSCCDHFQKNHKNSKDLAESEFARSMEFAERLVKRKLCERAETERNAATLNYQTRLNELRLKEEVFREKINYIKIIYKKTY